MPRDRNEKPALTTELARWLVGLRPEMLPESTRYAARLALLDTMGAALHGRQEFWAETALAWARQGSGAPGNAEGLATVWGEAGPSLRPADAALVNGVAAHAFELDDFIAKLHPGAVVVPAALALGERLDSAGNALETAVVAGYEVMVRASRALDPNAARLRGWHLTGVCGPLGAAAAGAVLLGLDEEAAAWALGLGATQGSGLFAFNADGAMSKRLHPGRAAHAGVMAAELAAMGFTGPASVLETDDGGFLDAFSDAAEPERLLEGLGREWAVEQVYFKPYSCCGSLHSYVDAAREIRNRLGRMPEPDETVRAGLPRVVDVQCGFDYEPGTALNGQMSARFTIAAALADGNALPAPVHRRTIERPGTGRTREAHRTGAGCRARQHLPGGLSWLGRDRRARRARGAVGNPQPLRRARPSGPRGGAALQIRRTRGGSGRRGSSRAPEGRADGPAAPRCRRAGRRSGLTASMPATLEDLFARLDEIGIAHSTVCHEPVFTVDENRELRGSIAGGHCKNLFLKNRKNAYWLVVCLEDAKIDLKAFGERIGAGRPSFGSADRLMEVLGILPGAVSPFALINDRAQRVQPVLQARMLEISPLNYHPLRNDRTTAIAPDDLVRFIEHCGHSPVIVDF